MKRIFFSLSLIFFLLLTYGINAETRKMLVSPDMWEKLSNVYLQDIGGEKIITLKEVEENSNILDLYINFDSSKILGNYDVLNFNYIADRDLKIKSIFSGRFVSPSQYVELIPQEYSIFSRERLGSFSISFWIYPHEQPTFGSIFVFKGIDSKGKEYTIEAFIRNSRIYWNFRNIFYNSEGVSKDIEIFESTPLKMEQWSHHSISYDILSGKLAVFVNGEEDNAIWLTETGKPFDMPLDTALPKKLYGSIRIIDSVFCNLDEFKIYTIATNGYEEYIYKDNYGVAVSKIIDMNTTGWYIKDIAVIGKIPSDTKVKFFYRVAGKMEYLFAGIIPWKEFKKGIEKETGRFVQLKMEIYGDNAKKVSPEIHKVYIYMEKEKIIPAPQIVWTYKTNDTITIYFRPVYKEDIMGYKVYYGFRSGDYAVNFDNSRFLQPLFIPSNFVSYVKPGLAKVDLRMKTNISLPMYISITAVDRNNEESPFSEETILK